MFVEGKDSIQIVAFSARGQFKQYSLTTMMDAYPMTSQDYNMIRDYDTLDRLQHLFANKLFAQSPQLLCLFRVLDPVLLFVLRKKVAVSHECAAF